VLKAMGLGEERAKSAVRFTFGKNNSKEEVDKVISHLKQIILSIRNVK